MRVSGVTIQKRDSLQTDHAETECLGSYCALVTLPRLLLYIDPTFGCEKRSFRVETIFSSKLGSSSSQQAVPCRIASLSVST